jgi:hypothetical protein
LGLRRAGFAAVLWSTALQLVKGCSGSPAATKIAFVGDASSGCRLGVFLPWPSSAVTPSSVGLAELLYLLLLLAIGVEKLRFPSGGTSFRLADAFGEVGPLFRAGTFIDLQVAVSDCVFFSELGRWDCRWSFNVTVVPWFVRGLGRCGFNMSGSLRLGSVKRLTPPANMATVELLGVGGVCFFILVPVLGRCNHNMLQGLICKWGCIALQF